MGWWFGRILTFEVEADDEAPEVGLVLSDASSGAIVSDATQVVGGFAAYGRSIRDAVQPLVDCFDVRLFDDGEAVTSASVSAAMPIEDRDLGNSADEKSAPRIDRQRLPEAGVPTTLRLSYYDPARDYQTGETRAVASERVGREAQQEIAAVLDASSAKLLAEQMLASDWASRDKVTIRLPPRFLDLKPGAVLKLPLSPSLWRAEQVRIDGFVVVVELSPCVSVSAAPVGDAGRIVASPDVVAGPLTIALLDIPNVLGSPVNEPSVLLAASSASPGWKSQSATVSAGGQSFATTTARRKSKLGHAISVLPGGGSDLLDLIGSVDVELIDPEQWLTSCDDDALATGENLAVLGGELVQFGSAVSLGGGRFRLSRLLRGLGGTEWACGSHGEGDVFCLLQTGTLQPVRLPVWSLGALVDAEAGTAETSTTFLADGLKPPSPVSLSASRDGDGGLSISWTRRSRLGFAWVDGIEAPLAEARELYRIIVTGPDSATEAISNTPHLALDAAAVTALGSVPASIEVWQIGDFGASRAAQISINF